MPAKQTSIQKFLKPNHLHAIGLVAAQWSSLELTVIFIIAKLAQLDVASTITLVAPSNFASWLEMLRKLTIQSKEIAWKEPQLVKLSEKMRTLQTARNGVVHAAWMPGQTESNKKWPSVSGIGVPKRGLKILLSIDKTPAQMRALAKAIESAESALVGWQNLRREEPQIKGLLGKLYDLDNPPTNPPTPDSQQQPSQG